MTFLNKISKACFPRIVHDKWSRRGSRFTCTACGHKAHADVNAAENIAAKGTSSLTSVLARRSGDVSRGK